MVYESFDMEELQDGHIYFLNTQKLGKAGNLGHHSDTRQYTIWETLENTARNKADRLYFIIDEAHRGMQGRAAGTATSIMQRFIKGSPAHKLSPMPVVLGMSATSARFNQLVGDTSSTLQKVTISPGEVRASGLLKDRILITYPEDSTKHHLFAGPDGLAKIRLNGWEAGLIAEEAQQPDFVCWLRNPPREKWSLCIPYEMGGETKATYPDFIIVRRDDVLEYVIDILEPHNPAFKDNLGKAKALAKYAQEEPRVGRVQLIRMEKDAAGNHRFKRLDMTKGLVRQKVIQAISNEELDHIFDIDGFF